MLRIHFTPADLGRVRLATEPDPLWETILSLFRWPGTPLPHGLARLAHGGDALGRLGDALTAHYDVAVAPHWDRVQAHVDADLACRTRALLDGGCEALLAGFRPLMRWEFPVLEVDLPADQDLDLEGRGLRLVPSYFGCGSPNALDDPDLPLVLVYPVGRGPRATDAVLRSRRPETLEALVGATRAWLLQEIGDGRTTGELARRVGVGPSSVSQHTTVLREAGLIHTSRAGRAVLHTLTPLGRSLLDEQLDPPGRAGAPSAGVVSAS